MRFRAMAALALMLLASAAQNPSIVAAAPAGEVAAHVPTRDYLSAAPDENPPAFTCCLAEAVAGLFALGICLRFLTMTWRRRRAARRSIERLGWAGGGGRSALRHHPPLRNLPVNPFSETALPAVLQRQIGFAAVASVEFGRTLGVIYLKTAEQEGRGGDECRDGSGDGLLALLADFRRALRTTDHVALLGQSEIIVCISLLPGLPELVAIAQRLRKVGEAAGRAALLQPVAGLAIYPLCGYRGGDLIEYARLHREDELRRTSGGSAATFDRRLWLDLQQDASRAGALPV